MKHIFRLPDNIFTVLYNMFKHYKIVIYTTKYLVLHL